MQREREHSLLWKHQKLQTPGQLHTQKSFMSAVLETVDSYHALLDYEPCVVNAGRAMLPWNENPIESSKGRSL
jgi:hypothetical protein